MKIEARKKSTGEIRFFTKEAWQMLEKGGHVRRNWDFIRRHEIAVPEEIRGSVEAADKAGREDLATLREPQTLLMPTGINIGNEGQAHNVVEYSNPKPGVHNFRADMPPKIVREDGQPFTFGLSKEDGEKGGILGLVSDKKSKKRRNKTAQ